ADFVLVRAELLLARAEHLPARADLVLVRAELLLARGELLLARWNLLPVRADPVLARAGHVLVRVVLLPAPLALPVRTHAGPVAGRALATPSAAADATAATSSAGSIGFVTCAWNPAASARSLSSDRANAVSAIAGSSLACGACPVRTRRTSS